MYLGIDFNNVFLKKPDDIVNGLKKYIGKGKLGYARMVLDVYESKRRKYNIREILDEIGGVAGFLRTMITDAEDIDLMVRRNTICFDTTDKDKDTKKQMLLKYAEIVVDKPVLSHFSDDDFKSQEAALDKMADLVTGGHYTIKNRLSETQDAAEFVNRFFLFLKGNFHPAMINNEDAPALSDAQAWHVIYVMQEYFGLLNDVFERCRECGRVFNSEQEGCCIDEESEDEDGKRYPAEDFGNYCGDCF